MLTRFGADPVVVKFPDPSNPATEVDVGTFFSQAQGNNADLENDYPPFVHIQRSEFFATTGVRIDEVKIGGIMQSLGVAVGRVVKSVNNQPIGHVSDLRWITNHLNTDVLKFEICTAIDAPSEAPRYVKQEPVIFADCEFRSVPLGGSD